MTSQQFYKAMQSGFDLILWSFNLTPRLNGILPELHIRLGYDTLDAVKELVISENQKEEGGY